MERETITRKMLHRFEQGEQRAKDGKLIVVDAVRGIKDPSEVTSYIMGYMKSVTSALSEIGIVKPQDIDIHESFMHIVVQDPEAEGTTGIEGLSDGMRAIASRENEYIHLGQSAFNHYVDGRKIGFAFARANARKGKFSAIAHLSEIPQANQEELKSEIAIWLTSQQITKVKPEIILNLHPISREIFSYIVTNGEDGLDAFIHHTIERVIKSTYYDNSKKAEIIGGIGKTIKFAKKARFLSSL